MLDIVRDDVALSEPGKPMRGALDRQLSLSVPPEVKKISAGIARMPSAKVRRADATALCALRPSL